ncbi:hypothetical protein AAC387_Pa10g0218 [Persea americana]
MQLMGVKPDVVSCNVLISALSQSRYSEEALDLIRQMRNFGLEPDVASGTTLFGGYVGFGYSEEAVSLFSKLRHSILLPDEHMFSIVLNACAGLEALEQGNTDGALGVLAHMQAAGISPDPVSWNTLIKGYVRSKEIGDAMQLLS